MKTKRKKPFRDPLNKKLNAAMKRNGVPPAKVKWADPSRFPKSGRVLKMEWIKEQLAWFNAVSSRHTSASTHAWCDWAGHRLTELMSEKDVVLAPPRLKQRKLTLDKSLYNLA